MNTAEVTDFNMYTATYEEWSAMTPNCNHCDHGVGATDRAIIYRCCHCGRERQEPKVFEQSTSSTWTYDKTKHGPHIQQSDIVRLGP